MDKSIKVKLFSVGFWQDDYPEKHIDKLKDAGFVNLAENTNEDYIIEIKTIDDLKKLYNTVGRRLILSFDKYDDGSDDNRIVIYDNYME